ncbi:MAG: nucleotidyltransferase family protein [Candidatus Acidiferrales bacterium]
MPPEIAGKIRALAAGALNWDVLLSEAEGNAVVPLLCRQLNAIAPDVVPAEAMLRVSEASRANTLRCLSLTAALVQILRLFQSEGIVALPYKGPVLAAQAYGDVLLRQFDDVDIIVRGRDMAKAHGVLLRLGYVAKFPGLMSPDVDAALVPGEYKYYSETRAAIVELHTERTLRHFPVAPDLDEFSARGVTVNLGGHDVRTFSPDDALLAICVHGSKDFWARIAWIADVSELIQSHPGLDWKAINARAEALQVQRMLHVGLILAASILDGALPEEIAGLVKADRYAEEIAMELERSLLDSDAPTMGALDRFRLRRRLAPGFFAGWRYALRLAMAPAEEDWLTLRLPRALAPLYILLRPLRLIQKYGRSHETA